MVQASRSQVFGESILCEPVADTLAHLTMYLVLVYKDKYYARATGLSDSCKRGRE